MGIEFITCEVCGRNFPDCRKFERCGNCGAYFCSQWCAKIECHCNEEKDYPHEHEECDEGCEGCSCVICRLEHIPEADLLTFLLLKYKLTQKEAEAEYREHEKATRCRKQ